jgi:hypothetical protein
MAIDTTKQAGLGTLHRAGTPCPAETVATFEHDCGSAGQGQRMPHGLDDRVPTQAPIHLTTSHDTSAWGCASVAGWGEEAGRTASPQAQRLLVRGDGGGSNRATPSLCKDDRQGLAHR